MSKQVFSKVGGKSPYVGVTLNRAVKVPASVAPAPRAPVAASQAFGVLPRMDKKTVGTTLNITQHSNILVVMDELVAYHNLPSSLLNKLPGYQAFKNIGIEFTNIHNNRQMCSPSRGSFQTSTINTGVQSNIDQPFQNFFVPHLSYESLTIPKSLKANNSEIIKIEF